jgi:hypothetical protein
MIKVKFILWISLKTFKNFKITLEPKKINKLNKSYFKVNQKDMPLPGTLIKLGKSSPEIL